MKVPLSMPMRGGLVALTAIVFERGFWSLCQAIWRGEGYLGHLELMHEPLFLLVTLFLGLAVVLGVIAVAIFLGLRWGVPALGATVAAVPEPLIAALLLSGITSIKFNWFFVLVGRIQTLCHYPGEVLYDIARGYWSLQPRDHWFFVAGLSSPSGSAVVVPLYWVTWLSAFCWGAIFVAALWLVGRFLGLPNHSLHRTPPV